MGKMVYNTAVYRVIYFKPFAPVEVVRFLEEQYDEGYILIAVDDGYYIFILNGII